MENCTFVDSWEDNRLSPEKLRMFGKRIAVRKEEDRMIKRMKEIYLHSCRSIKAEDLESTLAGHWKPASSVVSKQLNVRVKEPYSLLFYPMAHFETTFNTTESGHSQGQLAVLAKMPTQIELDAYEPVQVFLAPEGCKTVQPNLVSHGDFIEAGWKLSKVGICPERVETLKYGIQGKRKQYGLRHRIACTIHAGMGQDLSSVVTKIQKPHIDSDYSLWSREQVVVLLSRTNYGVSPAQTSCQCLFPRSPLGSPPP